MLDPTIVNAMVAPARADGELDDREEQLLQWIAEGRPVKAIAIAWNITPEAANDAIEDLFLKLAKEASAGAKARCAGCVCCRRRSSIAKNRARRCAACLPGGLAEKLRGDGRKLGETDG